MKTCLLLSAAILLSAIAQSKPADTTIEKKKYYTKRIHSSITLDGQLNEAAWNRAAWGDDFIQWMPYEGKAPSQTTRFKILYDNNYLYVGFRCRDTAPDSIIRRMSRRDELPGDWFAINIDSYQDQRTAFSFALSVSGVRTDEFISNNGKEWDASWNPIWFAKSHIDLEGWTGEIKIPFSQLRYGKETRKVWGLQVMRRLFRNDEGSAWQFVPQNAGVWVSGFGELHGLDSIHPHRQLEIAPYVIAQVDTYKEVPGNPFARGVEKKLTAGLDGKLAITNDLILDFTINPDFGQVEADPSQVRIDGFQNFLKEKRPFFVESRNIFDYQVTGSEAWGDFNADLLFYSRRIGSAPHGYPETNNDAFAKVPLNTTILGAAKFSGKTKNGLSIGLLETITEREWATIDHNGSQRKELAEPLTNYFVSRIQKDYREGNTIIGGIITGVNREEGLSDVLHRGAYSGGLDFIQFWKKRIWFLKSNLVFSHVQGSREAILNTQTNFEHLFQRPGDPKIYVDSTRTSLTGMGGTIKVGKAGGKSGKLGQVFIFETGVTFRSPQLELNDIGFMYAANEINHFAWAGLHFQKAFSVFRSAKFNYNHWSRWDYSGKHLHQAFNIHSQVTFKNNWQAGSGLMWEVFGISNNALRGAASIRSLPGLGNFTFASSDFRKKLNIGITLFNFFGFKKLTSVHEAEINLSYQPLNALRIALSGSYAYNWRRQDQFVSNVRYNHVQRSIVSEVTQRTIRFTGRLSYNITPDLTVQYYGQPFITRPLYDHFAFVTNPMAKNFDDRFYIFKPGQVIFNNGSYFIDENNDHITDYSFEKPDFNFVQFRSNLVARWEYKPGSEIYLVWSQGNTPDASAGMDNPVFNSLLNYAFAEKPRNIFLIKFTYRFLK